MITLLLILATSYWTYCSLFSVFVLVALYLEKKQIDRYMQKKAQQEVWQTHAPNVDGEEFDYCLERVYVRK